MPTWYDSEPEVGSTTETYMEQGERAALQADYFRRLKEWEDEQKQKEDD